MAYILDQNATVLCMHGAQAQPITTSQRVKAGGQYVCTQSTQHSISGCPYTVPPGSPMPCVMAQWTSFASRVKADGEYVLYTDSQAVCTPNGTGVNVIVSQLRVKAQ
jgi:hypothetical protein